MSSVFAILFEVFAAATYMFRGKREPVKDPCCKLGAAGYPHFDCEYDEKSI